MRSDKEFSEFMREMKTRNEKRRRANERLLVRYHCFILNSIALFKKIFNQNFQIDWDDVYQDAVVSLLESAKRRDVRKIFSFYVQREIINAIKRSINDEVRFQELVDRLRIELALYNRVVDHIRKEYNREPSTLEVAEYIRLPATQVAQLRSLWRAATDYAIIDCLTD